MAKCDLRKTLGEINNKVSQIWNFNIGFVGCNFEEQVIEPLTLILKVDVQSTIRILLAKHELGFLQFI